MGAIALVGMAAYFAGVVQAPITAFVIVEEMSDASSMVIPPDDGGGDRLWREPHVPA